MVYWIFITFKLNELMPLLVDQMFYPLRFQWNDKGKIEKCYLSLRESNETLNIERWTSNVMITKSPFSDIWVVQLVLFLFDFLKYTVRPHQIDVSFLGFAAPIFWKMIFFYFNLFNAPAPVFYCKSDILWHLAFLKAAILLISITLL